jgi:hypothetical protein
MSAKNHQLPLFDVAGTGWNLVASSGQWKPFANVPPFNPCAFYDILEGSHAGLEPASIPNSAVAGLGPNSILLMWD